MEYPDPVVNVYNVLVRMGIPMHRDTIVRLLASDEGWDSWDVMSIRSGRTRGVSSRVGRILRRYPELFTEVGDNAWWLTGKRQEVHHEFMSQGGG